MSESFNKCVVIVGPAEYGKTTAMRAEVAEHLREHKTGLAFVHDCNLQFRDWCTTYVDVAAWRAACAKNGGNPPTRGASIAGKATELQALVVELGQKHNRADAVRVPIALAYDESSLMGTSGATWMGEADTALVSNRRHWGIAPIYNVQEVTSLDKHFFLRATKVIAFSQPNEVEARTLDKRLGLPEGTLAQPWPHGLIQAPPYKYKVWRRGVGLVGPSSRRAA